MSLRRFYFVARHISVFDSVMVVVLDQCYRTVDVVIDSSDMERRVSVDLGLDR
jgi:hypothetical protein